MRSFEELTFMAEIRVVKREMREKYSAIRNEMDKAKRDEFDKKIFDRLTASITYRHSKTKYFFTPLWEVKSIRGRFSTPQ